MRTIFRWENKTFPTLLLCLIIFVPFLCTLLGIAVPTKESFILKENRNHNSFPDSPNNIEDISTWCKQFEEFFNDRYAFRQKIIATYHYIHQRINNNIVVKGQNGFLFLANENDVLQQHAGLIPINENVVTLASDNQKRIASWFNKRGIPYLCIIAPDKHSIYPEFLPTWIKTPNQKLFSPALEKAMDNNPLLLYLTQDILKAKQEDKRSLYYKTDTHWNDLGAFYAYQTIIKRMQKLSNESFGSLTNITFHEKETQNRDLARVSNSPKLKDTQIIPTFPPLISPLEIINITKGTKSNIPIYIERFDSYLVKNPKALNKKTVLCIRDSFFTSLSPYFYRTFTQTIYIPRDFAKLDYLSGLIDRYKPDFVIYEVVERFANGLSSALIDALPEWIPSELEDKLIQQQSKPFVWSPEQIVSSPFSGCTLSSTNNEITIQTHQRYARISLDFPDNQSKDFIIKLDLDSDENTDLSLVHTLNGQDMEVLYKSQIVKGHNSCFILAQAKSIPKSLKLDFGRRKNTCRIHSIKAYPIQLNTDRSIPVKKRTLSKNDLRFDK